ncbi:MULTISPECIES: hypothetical protein [Pseudomonas]|uniref:hypothetical protein n=1 Tax=Pseudomonas TaxID=286 RepID=UPI0014289EC6|nr:MULTISPECIES: hypothetical protein [Pseudomonas]
MDSIHALRYEPLEAAGQFVSKGAMAFTFEGNEMRLGVVNTHWLLLTEISLASMCQFLPVFTGCYERFQQAVRSRLFSPLSSTWLEGL